MNRGFEFQREGAYILYEMGKEFFVTGVFTPCNNGARCNCAIYITNNYDDPETAYIDFCRSYENLNFNFGFEGNKFSMEKCSDTPE